MTSPPSITLVHQDARGELYSISLPDNRELMLLHSTKGSLRGGHSHSVSEVVMLLTGKMRYHKVLNPLVTLTQDLEAGGTSGNAPGEVHMGEFLEDSWLIEFKLARKGEWTQENYEPLRARVRASTVG